MIVSLGEVEAMVRKAARGAGWPWGHAEELGASARALCAAGFPGAALAAALLDAHGDDGTCPIRQSAHWCDTRQLPDASVTVRCPLLSVPLLATVFCSDNRVLQARWDGAMITADATGHTCADDPHRAATTGARGIKFTAVHHTPASQAVARAVGVEVQDANWHALDRHAQHSYVPASEQSRMGAGPTD
ncbi:MAG: DUF3726 domain-containing protein [Pseudomonadota bacterium]